MALWKIIGSVAGPAWLLAVLVAGPRPALALEKYGRPLPPIGEVGAEGVASPREGEKHWARGYLLTAAFVSNPTFTARPDNTGRAGLRHMLHLETDLDKEYLQFYTDQNFFSNRDGGWVELTEWDATFALTGSVGNWGWRLQYERDAPLDRSGIKQIYADTLLTYSFMPANQSAWWRARFPTQNLTTHAGAGWLFHNDGYFARPENTGRALFRYVAHADLDLYRNLAVLFADLNFFTDRQTNGAVIPTELDWILGLALRWGKTELSVYHERDMPLDRPGFVQRYTALQLRVEFEWDRALAGAVR